MGCVGSRVDIEADGRQYHIKKLIASGGFSQIFSADDLETGEKVAIKKIVCHSSAELKRTQKEISCHRRFGTKPEHHHVMPIIGVSEERAFGSSAILFSLVFPLCKAGSVQDELTSRRTTKNYIPQERILRLFRQVCMALEVLHMARPPIAHRDLKPANLLYRDVDQILLTDFGSAVECPIKIENGRQSRMMLDEAAELCTMPYRAPELFTCEAGTVLDESVDIWSLGCVLYALCYFCSPYDFVHERGDSIALAVQSAKLKFEPGTSIDSSVTELISDLIKLEPKDRLKISGVLQRLHSFKF